MLDGLRPVRSARSAPRPWLNRDGNVRTPSAESDLSDLADDDDRELQEEAVSRGLEGKCLMGSFDRVPVPEDDPSFFWRSTPLGDPWPAAAPDVSLRDR